MIIDDPCKKIISNNERSFSNRFVRRKKNDSVIERKTERDKGLSWWRECSLAASAHVKIVEIELSGILALLFVVVFLTSEFRSQVTRDSATAARELVVGQGSGSIYLSRPQESRRGWRRFVRKVDKPERGGGSQIRSRRARVSRLFHASLASRL